MAIDSYGLGTGWSSSVAMAYIVMAYVVMALDSYALRTGWSASCTSCAEPEIMMTNFGIDTPASHSSVPTSKRSW